MSKQDLNEDDVFSNDVDPLDGIRALRKEEAAASDDPAATETDDDVEELQSSVDYPNEEPKPAEEPEEEDFEIQGTAEEIAENSDNLPEDEGKEEAAGDEKPTGIRTYKANGKDFEFTEQEVLDQFGSFFGKAMDYTQKLQKIAPYRKMVSAIEEEGVTQESLNIALDALKGDKNAIQKILELNEIEAFDLPTETEDYVPNDYGKSESQEKLSEIISELSADADVYPITVDVVDKQWDADSRRTFAENPDMIRGLHNDIKSGLFDKVAPLAMKEKVLDGNTKSDIEYYILAGQKYTTNQQGQQAVDSVNRQTQEAVQNSDQASSEAQRRRSASSTRKRSDVKSVVDYLDDDDEAFDAWYKKIQANN